MKKILLLISALVLVSISLSAETAGSEDSSLKEHIRESVSSLSKTILDQYPDINIKKGLIITDIEELSPGAVKKRMGNLVKVYLEEVLTNSMLVYIVDRDNLETSMKEIKLALSGITDSTGPEPGFIKGAELLLTGSVMEEGQNYRISLSLTDIETGELLTTLGFTVPNSEMVAAAEDLQYQYVAANGIGISVSPLYVILGDDVFNELTPIYVDLRTKYRLSRSLMIGGGVMVSIPAYAYRLDDEDNSWTWSHYQPDLAVLDDNVGQATNDISQGIILHIDFQYTLNFSPCFNIGFNAGVLGSPGIQMKYDISSNDGLRVKLYDYDSGSYTIVKDRTPLVLGMDPIFGGKIEICPEFFITPRFAVSGIIGYMLTSKASVNKARGTYADWSFSQTSIDSNYNDFADDLYFGFDPSLAPDGNPWSIDLSGLYAGLTISLFF